MKKALSEKGAAEATKKLQASKAKKKAEEEALGAADGDVAGTGEEEFEDGMRQNMMERDAADADNDGKLDFGEFCQFVRDREEGEFTEEELKKRFDALDEDGSGKVDIQEANAQRDGRKTHDATARFSQRPRGVITAVQGPRYGVAAL